MAIGRTEERDTARDSVMLRHRESVCDPIRVTHLGQRSIRPHSKAGHMTAIDQTCPRCKKTLRGGGRPHMSQSPFCMPIRGPDCLPFDTLAGSANPQWQGGSRNAATIVIPSRP